MSSAFPAPPIPSDVDLRSFPWMPLYGDQLFTSDFNYLCSDAEWRAGVTLWWAAWKQIPAGSLPDDDRALCNFAGLGKDIKAWKKLKNHAMRGFVKCSDDRWYHLVLAEKSLKAWKIKKDSAVRKERYLNASESKTERVGNESGTRSERSRNEKKHVPVVPVPVHGGNINHSKVVKGDDDQPFGDGK